MQSGNVTEEMRGGSPILVSSTPLFSYRVTIEEQLKTLQNLESRPQRCALLTVNELGCAESLFMLVHPLQGCYIPKNRTVSHERRIR